MVVLENIVSVALALLLSTRACGATKMSFFAADLLEEDETFWGRLLGGTSMSTDDTVEEGCVKYFDSIESLVEASKEASGAVSIRLCKDARVEFGRSIDMTGAKFAMTCENDSCQLDGQGKTSFFKAGEFGGPSSTHEVSFDTIHFFNGKSSGPGGAFQMFGGQTSFEECAFLNNVASDGGAMRIQDGIVTISSCLFQYNSADDVGGAMKVEESVNGVLDMTIRDSVFTENDAATEGDDIYQDYAERSPIDCGEGNGNQFCDAASSSQGITTNWPTSTCSGASTDECPVVDHNWNVVELF